MTSPEQTLSAELDPPPPNPPNPLELDNSDAHLQVVVKHFPHGNPGAPINVTPGCSIYESMQEALGGSVWALFQSECNWRFAHWVKMYGNMRPFPPPFFFLYCVTKCSLSL